MQYVDKWKVNYLSSSHGGKAVQKKVGFLLIDGCNFRLWVVDALDEDQLPEVFNHQISPTLAITLLLKQLNSVLGCVRCENQYL